MGMVAVDDLAMSLFVVVTAQVQVFGRIVMANAAAVSDMSCNSSLHCPVTINEMESDDSHGLFHGLPEELRIMAVIAAMEQASATWEACS